jgi:hypothetical protein
MQKIKQQWVLRWMYEADVVAKSMFAIVLEYLNGIQGAAREVRSGATAGVCDRPEKNADLWLLALMMQRVMDSAQEIIDAGVPSKEEEDAASEKKEKMLSIKLARRRYKRALQVAELLA